MKLATNKLPTNMRKSLRICTLCLVTAILPSTAKCHSILGRDLCDRVTITIRSAIVTRTRMELLHFILAAYGMTFIIIHGHIFNKIRPPCKSMGGFGRLFHCHLCLGFWVGVFLCGINRGTQLFTFEPTIINCFILGCVSSGTSYILNTLFCDDGIQIGVKK